jgi:hypothetical protein
MEMRCGCGAVADSNDLAGLAKLQKKRKKKILALKNKPKRKQKREKLYIKSFRN